jgi:hypothetical protein
MARRLPSPVEVANQLITRSCELARRQDAGGEAGRWRRGRTLAERMRVMSVEEFRDRDADYLGWVAAHRDGYVINIGRSGRGYARLHRVTCGTITSRPLSLVLTSRSARPR